MDVRGCYTAMAIAHMLGMDKQRLAERAGMADFLRRCQVSMWQRSGRSGCTIDTATCHRTLRTLLPRPSAGGQLSGDCVCLY